MTERMGAFVVVRVLSVRCLRSIHCFFGRLSDLVSRRDPPTGDDPSMIEGTVDSLPG